MQEEVDKWIQKLDLSRGGMFQSLLPFTQTGHPAHRMMALRIENTLDDAYLAQDTQWPSFICSMFRHMIASERLMWSQHFVFYRTVNEKYVLYQFNTHGYCPF